MLVFGGGRGGIGPRFRQTRSDGGGVDGVREFATPIARE